MLYIVLPVHNRSATTADFVEGLLRQSNQKFVLVLVDDGCTDNTVAMVRTRMAADKLVLLRGDGNLWWAGALQLAWDYLRSVDCRDDDAVLIANDDMTFGPEFTQSGLSVLDKRPNSCVQAVGVDRSSGAIDYGVIADLRVLRFRAAQTPGDVNCLSTRGLMMRLSTFVQSGGFRPAWLPHYLSDYEFTIRLGRRGVALLSDPSFRAVVDTLLTGDETYRRGNLRAFWAAAFSNKAKYNPKHWSAFAICVCPPAFLPFNLAKIWLRFIVFLATASLPRVADPLKRP